VQIAISKLWIVPGKKRQMRAKFNVCLNSDPATGATVYGFRLMQSPHGDFWLAVPSRPQKGGTWEKVVTLSADLHTGILNAAVEAFEARGWR
jgi:hypothetical protein